MKPPPNQVDKFGFPIPPKFEEHLPPPSKQVASGRTKAVRGVLILLLIAAIASFVFQSNLALWGRQLVAEYLGQQAQDKYYSDDLNGALANLDDALEWAPAVTNDEGGTKWRQTVAALYRLRSQLRLEAQDLEGSLDDCKELVKLVKSPQSLTTRSVTEQRLGLHREAIDDLTEALKLCSVGERAFVLNNRAYFRALAGIELEEGLQDAEEAVKSANERVVWSYLDTRGYLHHLLGNQDKALADLDLAIRIGEQLKQELLLYQGRSKHERQLSMMLRQHNESLSVLYHHRGQIHEKLGDAERAKSDLARGDKLGYDPKRGIY